MPQPMPRPRRPHYFSPGPKPRTERGKRRHAARSDSEQKHAADVHVSRDVYFAALGHAYVQMMKPRPRR